MNYSVYRKLKNMTFRVSLNKMTWKNQQQKERRSQKPFIFKKGKGSKGPRLLEGDIFPKYRWKDTIRNINKAKYQVC